MDQTPLDSLAAGSTIWVQPGTATVELEAVPGIATGTLGGGVPALAWRVSGVSGERPAFERESKDGSGTIFAAAAMVTGTVKPGSVLGT